ncbi:MAG: peroxide stress protein YaaA [Candidatus Cloacimonadota bacterium]|nr:MAG: peroxide stress protein YaaA [Candidatus Cloacimonadota bacterium]
MKIIFSPAKELNLAAPVKKDRSISEHTEKIISVLKSFSPEELRKCLKISPALLRENIKYIKNFDNPVSYHAIDLYNGLAYRNLCVVDFSETERAYLIDHLILLSALYGPIQADSLIKPYRLDFHSQLKIDGKSLKSFWKMPYNNYFKKGETIINLASDEFSGLFDRSRFNWIDIAFFERKNGELKKHSSVSKKARGLMLRFMAKNKITNIDEIRSFDTDGYFCDNSLSNEKSQVFIR